jgi:AcrR family transcriptional regulator
VTLALHDKDARREVLLAAADAVVQRDGASASMTAIAAEAGITKPILYRHFGDKGGLYAALAERHTDRLLDQLTAALSAGRTARDRVERTVDAYLAAIEDEPQVYRFLVQSEEAVHLQGQVRGFVRRLQEQLGSGIAAELGLPPGDLRAAVWAAGIVGMVQGAGEWWLETRDCSRSELTAQLTALLWGAYGAAAGDLHLLPEPVADPRRTR